MKRLLSVFLFLLPLAALGQQYQFIPGYGFRWLRAAFDSTMHVPLGLTSTSILTRPGDLRFNTADNSLYIDTTGTGQFKMIGSGGGGSGATIYTADGTLLGNRIVDANSNYIAFNRVGAPFAVFSNNNLGSMYDTVGSVFQIDAQKLFFNSLRGGATGFKPSFNVVSHGSDDYDQSIISWSFSRQVDGQEESEFTMFPNRLMYTGPIDTSLIMWQDGRLQFPKYKNNVTEDSVLTTDQFGNVKMKLAGGGAGDLQAVTTSGNTTDQGVINNAEPSGTEIRNEITSSSPNQAIIRSIITDTGDDAGVMASTSGSDIFANHSGTSTLSLLGGTGAYISLSSPSNRIQFNTGGSLNIHNGIGVLNTFSNTGTLTGAPATAGNMFVTRQQVTDSISGRTAPSWQQTLAVNAVATSSPQAPTFITTGTTALSLRNDDATILFRNTANTGQVGYLQGRDGTNMTLATTQNVSLQFRTNDIVRMNIGNSGNVGIGGNPAFKLAVTGGRVQSDSMVRVAKVDDIDISTVVNQPFFAMRAFDNLDGHEVVGNIGMSYGSQPQMNFTTRADVGGILPVSTTPDMTLEQGGVLRTTSVTASAFTVPLYGSISSSGVQTSVGISNAGLIVNTGTQTMTTAGAISIAKNTIYVDNTAAITITLPAVAGSLGREYKIIKRTADAFAVTIDPNGLEQINSSNSVDLTAQWDYIILHCDGTRWLAFSPIP